ncbi:hypothetical protein HUT18_14980 [Streptomyces sp. NA04227]|uniref:hypothetical protein n=1 Tax=Streptomyces sp. NA04227 TaxID=2742136 RepID=UPI001591628E|nr:hypothetical protein [Streptomyces sp. NA04227]QKW07493.1 hypothetical protein HUT18_14980 [Streptomyces sp. NA04227]
MIKKRTAVCLLLCGAIAAATPAAQAALLAPQWQRVGTGITGGVSGMAVQEGGAGGEGSADLVVVRDNKKAGESRVATVRLRPGEVPVTRELDWSGPLPADLEALDAVPGQPGRYVAVTSAGMAYEIVVAGGTATVQGDPVALPDRRPGDNYESFALWSEGASGRVFAVWATRGAGSEHAMVRAAEVRDGGLGAGMGAPSVREFAVPVPDRDEVRHISDLKVLADGRLLVSSASDPNVDDGPFSSAVYDAGQLVVRGQDRVVLNLREQADLVPLRTFTLQDNRKIEAVTVLPDGQAVWGTDDENQGGSVSFDSLGS